jgi:nitroreductase
MQNGPGKMTRRDFLKGIGAWGAVLTGFPFLASCSGVKRSVLRPESPVFPQMPNMDRKIVKILYYASLAPSGHNAQPWYVRTAGSRRFIIGLDQGRRLPVVDPDNRESLISIGAFIENLSIAAAELGLAAEVEPIASDSSAGDIALIILKETCPVGYPLEKISMRRTVRTGFRRQEIRWETLSEITGHMKESVHYFPMESAHGRCIAEKAIQAFREQTGQDEAQEELSRWIRFSSREAEERLDGLTPESMEIQGIAGWYVRHFMNSGDVMKDSFRLRSIDLTAAYARQGSGWLVLTGKGNSPADLMETGRAFERFLLEVRERKIAVHPMNQILEVEDQRKNLISRHGPGFIPHLILRIGYIDAYPDPVSLRRPVSSFLRK